MKIRRFCLFAIVLITLQGCNYAPSNYDEQNTNETVISSNEIQEAVNYLNSASPFMVNEEVRFDGIFAIDVKTIIIKETLINFEKEFLDLVGFEELMKPELITDIKSNSEFKVFIDNRTTIKYQYSDKNGVFIVQIIITPDDYAY